jgi:hypothetical protein
VKKIHRKKYSKKNFSKKIAPRAKKVSAKTIASPREKFSANKIALRAKKIPPCAKKLRKKFPKNPALLQKQKKLFGGFAVARRTGLARL